MRIAGIASLLVLFAACSSQLDEMRHYQSLWSQKGPASYQYTYHQHGDVPSMQLEVTVNSHAVSNTTVISSGLPSSQGIQGLTVEGLYFDLKNRLQSGCKVRVSYDETIGYPLSVYSDCGQEGDGWDVSDLAARE